MLLQTWSGDKWHHSQIPCGKLPFLFPAVRGNKTWPEHVLGSGQRGAAAAWPQPQNPLGWKGNPRAWSPTLLSRWKMIFLEQTAWEKAPFPSRLFQNPEFGYFLCLLYCFFRQGCVANTKAVTEGLVPHSPLGLQLSFPSSPQGNPIFHEHFVECFNPSPRCREVATCLQGHFTLG